MNDALRLDRNVYDEDHEGYRAVVRDFFEREVVPHEEQWGREGAVSRDLWLAAGAAGHLCHQVDPAHGGAGVEDYRFPTIVWEEQSYALSSGPGFSMHSSIVVPYLEELGTDEQQARWLPAMVTGERIGALAMSEPGAGSDLAGIRTRAVRDGDSYVVNGGKTFITNGQLADLVVVACRTSEDRHRGLTLLVLERGMEGFERGRNLEKMGMKAQDTSELFFTDVRVPLENRLGDEGDGFRQMMRNLPQERLLIGTHALGAMRRMVEITADYVRDRKAFGGSIGALQHIRFQLAEMVTEVEVATSFHDACIAAHVDGDLTAEQAAMAKWWLTDLQCRIADRCVQLHGGYGYMMEYPITRAYLDARVQPIYGGTNEIMKEIIGRRLDLEA